MAGLRLRWEQLSVAFVLAALGTLGDGELAQQILVHLAKAVALDVPMMALTNRSRLISVLLLSS